MADQVDSMSDAELRTKLAEHGFPVMPITASTRKLLVKKLKLVLENKVKPRLSAVDEKAGSRKSLARYSSGEESDLDSSVTIAKDKRNRRTTTGGPPPPASTKVRRAVPKKDSPAKVEPEKGSDSEDERKTPVRTHEEVETVTTRRVTRTYAANDVNEYETGSDSDVDADKTKGSRSNSRSSDYISSTLPPRNISPIPTKGSIFSRTTTHNISPNPSPPKSTLFSGARSSINLKPSSYRSSLSSVDSLDAIRSRLGLSTEAATSTYSPRFTVGGNYNLPSTSNDEVESPYLSNFTRRLSALKSEPKTILRDSDINNGSSGIPRRSYLTGVARSDMSLEKVASDKKFLQNNLVSFSLVIIVALFFFCLSFMYLIKKNDITSVVDDQNSIIPICQLNIPGNRPGINCVPKEQVSYAKDLLKVIHPELTSRAAAYKCGQPGAVPYMTEREIIDIANARAESVDVSQCRTDLNNLQVLLVHNPRWGINVVQLKSLYSKDVEYSTLKSTDVVVQQRNKGNVAIVLSDPSTPISCFVVNTLLSAGSTLVIIGFLTLLILGLQRFYKYYVGYKKKKNEEIYSMVEQIIDIISQETEDRGVPYISVDHVRDNLISPQNREKMAPIWDEAVKFIQRNESRVRMEVQSVDGEDCRVWRWISQNSPKRSTTWQGQAFETQEGSVNNLTVSPTPCLKIRNMFDKNDANPNLRSVIQDAILEKCGGECNILHIDIERTSCCVYVKCASQADAGVVYRNLHGWWYEGRLITVKYLRLERYMQRFPNSPSVGPYLKMSQPRHTWEE